MPEYGNYFCSKGCLLEYNAGRDAFADEEDDRPFPIRRRPDSDEEPASINGAAGTSGARSKTDPRFLVSGVYRN